MFFLLLLLPFPLGAVETRLVGTVTNEQGEPIPNASVVFRRTQVGTATDAEGLFYLHVDLRESMVLKVSAVGYHTELFSITPGMDVGLEVQLRENANLLEEVIILPGENPALALLDSVRAHRADNAPRGVGQVQDEAYLSHITARHLSRRLWRSMQSGMVQQADSTYLLPLPQRLYGALLSELPETLDFYRATIPLGSASFLSPVAQSASTYYHLSLRDSLSAPKRYVVAFRPKNTFNSLFDGQMEVDSATYAISGLRVSVPQKANVNFVSSMAYDMAQTDTLYHSSLRAVFDVAVRSDSSHTFPSLLVQRQYAQSLLASAMERPVLPSVVAMPDTLPMPPFVRLASWLAYALHTGYISTGTPIDIGRAVEIIGYSRYEGLHLGLPFRTNERLFPHVSFEGYVAYGLRDRGLKYKAQASVLLPTSLRHLLTLSWWDHYVRDDVSSFDALALENSIAYGDLRFTSILFSQLFYNPQAQGVLTPAVREREGMLRAESEWQRGSGARPSVETTLTFRIGRMGYGDAADYHYYDMPSFSYHRLSAVVRLGWGERVADIYTVRKHLYSSLPTLFLGGEIGNWFSPATELEPARPHLFGNLHFLLRQDASLGMGGVLSYSVQGGVILGRVPVSLLQQFRGNRGYTYAPEMCTFLNPRAFAADRYLIAQANWNGRGVLFNLIPGWRYLRLRELAECKVAWGALSPGNQYAAALPPAPAPYSSLTVPYAEVGVGIGNIARVGEVYSIWKLTHRSDPNTARWAIRFRFNIGL